MTKKFLERKELSNGLVLEFWDESRKLAGDRWYVGIRAVVPVPVDQYPPENISLEVIQLIRSEVGDHIYFQHKTEKNFVAESEVNSLREHLKELFIENSLSYLSHPDFPKRFLALKLAEVADKMHMGDDYLQKVLDQLRAPSLIGVDYIL